MTDYKSFLSLLEKYKLIEIVYSYLIPLIEDEINDEENKSSFIILFSIYFCLLCDGNITMSLDKEKLKTKWEQKLNAALIQASEEAIQTNEIENDFNIIKSTSIEAIENELTKINEEQLPNLIGQNKMFMIDDGYLYAMKYYVARKGILSSVERLFKNTYTSDSNFDYKDCINDGVKLTKGQDEAVIKGVSKNLIITGGPGTGKTTSILFLLLNLLESKNPDETIIYLAAPSGKASSRMKESIIGGFNLLKPEYKTKPEIKRILDKLEKLEESTIHRLLGRDPETNGFNYNKKNMFAKNSVFIIDEASMIDASLFNSLLQAIPNEARIFIMGDKNQLPSVDCGAVFGDLLSKPSLKENIVELDESKRFSSDTKIYELAKAINEGSKLPITEDDFEDYETFYLRPNDKNNMKEKPVFYYLDHKEGTTDKEIISFVCQKWGEAYYKDLQRLATNLDSNNMKQLEEIYSQTEFAKILCAANKGERGVSEINKSIKNNFIDASIKSSTFNNHYPGELMMINKNNKQLDLYNGDSGILVSFSNDKTLYFMVKKSSNIISEIGKKEDKIFKLGDSKNSFIFYPLRMISSDEIDLSYAITIHKSQGSDYKNILVILPNKKGHPLLNRQIVYTAITRTKGNTYILSSFERLNEAKDTLLERDTNLA